LKWDPCAAPAALGTLRGVFTYAYDVQGMACVWLMSGTSNTDDDFARYIATIQRFDTMAAGWSSAVAVMVVDKDNPRPDAVWRKRMADASTHIRSKPVFALVSQSPIIRGVLTAINWLRPPPFETAAFASFEEATQWAQQRTGRSLPILAQLLDRARQDAATGTIRTD